MVIGEEVVERNRQRRDCNGDGGACAHTHTHTHTTLTVGRWKKMGTLGGWDCGGNNAVYERHGDQAISENGVSHS